MVAKPDKRAGSASKAVGIEQVWGASPLAIAIAKRIQ